MTNHSLRVAIVGGGIGGLTLGLALREHGVNAEIYEAAPELAEIGAAVAQSANATKILRRLGLLDQLTAVATAPTELIYREGRTGRRIAGHPVRNDGWYEAKFGAPTTASTAPTCSASWAAPSAVSTCTWAASSRT